MQHVLTMSCQDRPGIVRAISEGIVEARGNILENAQFSDPVTGLFCVRTHFETPEEDARLLERAFGARLDEFNPELSVRQTSRKTRTLIMVSRFDHCLVDLLYRWEMGELPIEIPLVVSNHKETRGLVERHGIPFIWIPIEKDEAGPRSKVEAEARLMELIDEHDIDLVVLARYMQVLSDDTCKALAGRAINIHHSFLPGFKGAKPYHQAHDRGVKLIGATAHYVTPELDEGPIIEQDVRRVSHAHDVQTLVSLGRDVERMVLARAVQLHAESRIILAGNRTVVFG